MKFSKSIGKMFLCFTLFILLIMQTFTIRKINVLKNLHSLFTTTSLNEFMKVWGGITIRNNMSMVSFQTSEVFKTSEVYEFYSTKLLKIVTHFNCFIYQKFNHTISRLEEGLYVLNIR